MRRIGKRLEEGSIAGKKAGRRYVSEDEEKAALAVGWLGGFFCVVEVYMQGVIWRYDTVLVN